MYSEGIKILFLAHTSSVPKPVVCWSYVENPIEQQWSQFYRIRRYNLSELLVTASVTNIIGKISFYCTFDWRVTLRGRTNARNSHMEGDLKSNLRITSRIKESRVRHEWWIEWIKKYEENLTFHQFHDRSVGLSTYRLSYHFDPKNRIRRVIIDTMETQLYNDEIFANIMTVLSIKRYLFTFDVKPNVPLGTAVHMYREPEQTWTQKRWNNCSFDHHPNFRRPIY